MDNTDVLAEQNSGSVIRKEQADIKLGKIRDAFCEKTVLVLTAISAIIIVFIFIFILNKAWGVLKFNGLDFILKKGFDTQIRDAFSAPGDQPVWGFGALGLFMGSVATTLGALIIAVPMSLGTAIVITELAPRWLKKVLQSMIRLLASIPSVIFGLIGLMVIVPFIRENLITTELQIQYIKFFQITGSSLLAGVIVLSIMIIPIIVALSVDAINAVPFKYKEASLALGLSHWRTIVKVILPAAKSGILAGVILGTGRAIGEAIALSMVSGGVGNIPNPAHGYAFFLTPVLTLASAIVNKSEAIAAPTVESALFACGVVLLVTCTVLSISTKIVEHVIKRREGIE